MSLISSTVSASSVLPSLGVHGHGHHKKGATTDAADPSNPAQSASTQGLLSRLLQTAQQVTGVPVDALTGLASPAAATHPTLQPGHAVAGGAGALGSRVNVSA